MVDKRENIHAYIIVGVILSVLAIFFVGSYLDKEILLSPGKLCTADIQCPKSGDPKGNTFCVRNPNLSPALAGACSSCNPTYGESNNSECSGACIYEYKFQGNKDLGARCVECASNNDCKSYYPETTSLVIPGTWYSGDTCNTEPGRYDCGCQSDSDCQGFAPGFKCVVVDQSDKWGYCQYTPDCNNLKPHQEMFGGELVWIKYECMGVGGSDYESSCENYWNFDGESDKGICDQNVGYADRNECCFSRGGTDPTT